MRRRLAFFGSPAWAVPVLRALSEAHDVALVVTQPDKPQGRGLKVASSAVAQAARELGLEVAKPRRLRRDQETAERLRVLDLDAAVVAAYGQIIPGALLEIPRYGFLNIHPSLLPKYRGAAPVNWALINGERETGVSIMRLDEGMDTGPIFVQEATPVGPDETAVELSERLRDRGVELLLDVLERLETARPRPQEGEPSYAPLLKKEDGRIRWHEPAQSIYDRHRGVQPWPGSWFEHSGQRVKLLEMKPARGEGAPGEVLDVGRVSVRVAAGEGAVELVTVQPEGKRPMAAAAWARGRRLGSGRRIAS
ncbi:methionyl-tRNA formyltransferase [Oceanithermus sp.]